MRKVLWPLITLATAVCCGMTGIKTIDPDTYLLLDGQTPVRKVERTLILTDVGDSKIWICNDPDCPEGCNSQEPNLFGNGLLLKESQDR